MSKKDLTDVCNYMKAIVVPDIPDDFVVAETFRYGLSDAELKAGITAFRTFLHALYDKLAADRDKIDVETGRNFDPDSVDGLIHGCFEGSVHKCFPVINDLAVILFNLGYRGKLETKPEHKLVLTGKDLLTPFDYKNEKYNSLINMTGERKSELFSILSKLGFKFEGVDFSKEIDFSIIKTFNVKHENNYYLPVGLKLLAEAQANKKSAYYNLKAVFMRCDFYPLATKKVKVKELNFNLFLNPHSPEIRDWLISIDKFLCDNGCKVVSEINNFNSNIILIYTSRKSNNKVCKIHMGIEGCKAFPYGRHFIDKDNILTCLPESMLDTMSDGKHECSGCASKNPDWCAHGGGFKFTHKGKKYNRCQHNGFGFPLGKAEEREIIEKWIVMELAWS